MTHHPDPHALTADALRDVLPSVLAVSRWADDVLAEAPYVTVDALVAAARAAATPLTDAEIDEALAAHPRIGERPTSDHGEAEARFSRAEQASSDAGDADLAAQLADGNRAYEDRFGRVFLIRAAGRTRAEMLAELHRRLTLDDDTERATVAVQLREIMALRLRATFADDDGAAGTAEEPGAPSLVTTHILDTASGRPAAGVPVRLDALAADGPREVGSGVTDDDGRVRTLGPAALTPGRYRLTFETAEYLAESADENVGGGAFFPEVAVTFVVGPDDVHLHVPLLLSPFGYSTYRGS